MHLKIETRSFVFYFLFLNLWVVFFFLLWNRAEFFEILSDKQKLGGGGEGGGCRYEFFICYNYFFHFIIYVFFRINSKQFWCHCLFFIFHYDVHCHIFRCFRLFFLHVYCFYHYDVHVQTLVHQCISAFRFVSDFSSYLWLIHQ